MDYVKKLNCYREERKLFLSQDVDMFDELLEYFFFLEIELLRLIKAFNRHYIFNNKKERIKCYPRFNCLDDVTINHLKTNVITAYSGDGEHQFWSIVNT